MTTRREILRAATLLPVVGISDSWVLGAQDPFTLGIASGSPKSRSVILWTRLAPDPLHGGGMPKAPVRVDYRISGDPEMQSSVYEGHAIAEPEFAHSVHVPIDGLIPGKDYWYQFYVGSFESPIGRTRTTPTDSDEVRLAVASCQHYEHGYYAAYRDIAEWSPDCVIHLGDYIYEYGAKPVGIEISDFAGLQTEIETVRSHNSAEIRTLWAYRNRHAQYRLDPDLQAAHASAPWLVTLDDHEIANNWAGYSPEDPNRETSLEFQVRRQAALRAFYEHMPVEKPPTIRGALAEIPIHGEYLFGPAQILLMDTRQFRSDQVCGQDFPYATACDDLTIPELTMSGADQERWLLSSIQRSSSPFVVMAQQTWFAPYDYDPEPNRQAFNMDQWDGYQSQRNRIIATMASSAATPIVLSGDWHCAAAMNIHRDPFDSRTKLVGYEFATTSISSHCIWTRDIESARPNNQHVQYIDGKNRGYIRCSVSRKKWKAEYRTVADARIRESAVTTQAEIEV